MGEIRVFEKLPRRLARREASAPLAHDRLGPQSRAS